MLSGRQGGGDQDHLPPILFSVLLFAYLVAETKKKLGSKI